MGGKMISRIRLTSAKVEVEVEAELGNTWWIWYAICYNIQYNIIYDIWYIIG